MIIAEVKGIVFKNEDGTRRQDIIAELKERDLLILLDDGSFEYPEAIGIYTGKEKRIGFLPSELAYQIKEMTNDFSKFKVHIDKIHGSGGTINSCSIVIDDVSWETDEGGNAWLILDTENEEIVSLAESGERNTMDLYIQINKLNQELDSLQKEYDVLAERLASLKRRRK